MPSIKLPSGHEHMKQLTANQQRLMEFVLRAPDEVKATSTKLVKNPKDTGKIETPKEEVLNLAGRSGMDIIDIRHIKSALPEIETAQEILVASILSPHDMLNEELSWSVQGDLPAEIASEMLNVVRSHFEDDLRFNEKLTEILGNALFDRGSHILAVFPESSIDDVINSRTNTSLESFKQATRGIYNNENGKFVSKGILGKGILNKTKEIKNDIHKKTYSLESFYGGNHTKEEDYHEDIIPGLLRISDNVDSIKFSALQKSLVKQQVNRSVSNLSLESVYFNPTDETTAQQSPDIQEYYREVNRRTYSGVGVINDRNNSTRKSIGHPLLYHLPHESTIPVFTPGDPTDHLGYIVVLDGLGNPITYTNGMDNPEDMNEKLGAFGNEKITGHQSVVHQTINEMSMAINGKSCDLKEMTVEKMTRFCAEIIEKDMVTRLQRGAYGENIEIARPLHVYKMMLARALSGSMTQLLYIPASLVTYIAFYYDEFGIGQSLITKAKTLASLRIATMFSNTLAMVNNAAGSKVMNITLDEMDANPDETIAKLINRNLEANSLTSLFHTFDPSAIERELHRHGWTINIDGNAGVENTKVEIEHKSGDRPTIDDNYIETLKKDFISAIHVPSVILDQTSEVNFSSEFTEKHALFIKRNKTKGIAFNAFMHEFVSKYTLHDGTLIKALSEIIRSQYTKLPQELIDEMKAKRSTIPAIELFLSQLEVAIPLPGGEQEENQQEAFEKFSKKVESFIDPYLNDEVVKLLVKSDDADQVKEAKEGLKDLLTSHLLVDWIRRNNAFPEFEESFFFEGKPNKEIVASMLNTMQNFSDLFGGLYGGQAIANNPDGEDTSSADSSSDTSSEDSGTEEASGNDDEFEFNAEEESEDEDESEDEEKEEESEEEEETPEEDTDTEGESDATEEETKDE